MWSQKVDVNMIFTGYWKVLALIFPRMGNTVFFWAKKVMERWYLLITEKFLFWTFRWWEIWSFLSQEVDGKMIFTGYLEVCFEFFGDGKYCLFLAKKLMERLYILDLFELSKIFWDLGNMVFRAVKLVSTTRSHITKSARNYLLFVPNYNSVRI